MLPLSYQTCLQSQLSETQFVTLEILVELLQQERQVMIERLATLFPQPILFDSRRKALQRFLNLPQLTPEALWFPILKHWIKRYTQREQPLLIVMDRTEWADRNLFMISLVYQNRSIPVYWQWLDKLGQSNFSEQKRVLRPVLQLLKSRDFILLGDREFHSIELAAWCVEKQISFVFRLPKSTTVQPTEGSRFTRLDDLPQDPGCTDAYLQIPVTQKRGFGNHNLIVRQKRAYRQVEVEDAWYLLTNLTDSDQAVKSYQNRFSIEPLFRDYKSGGYHLEACKADPARFTALLVLIAIAYSIATLRGRRIRNKGVQHYVGRVKEPKRAQNRHSLFWIGLYGSLWIDSLQLWSSLADKLMALKPQKRPFFQRGLSAIALIQSAL
jgi:Transposase DDE domain